MVGEQIVQRTEVLEMEVRGGNHVQLSLHCLGVVNGRKTLMADGGSIVALGGIRHGAQCVVVPDDRNLAKKIWNRLAKWLQENLRLAPVDFGISCRQ